MEPLELEPDGSGLLALLASLLNGHPWTSPRRLELRAQTTDQQKAGEFKPSQHPSADAHVHEERSPATARQRILREPARRRGAIAPRQLRQLVSCRSGPIADQS